MFIKRILLFFSICWGHSILCTHTLGISNVQKADIIKPIMDVLKYKSQHGILQYRIVGLSENTSHQKVAVVQVLFKKQNGEPPRVSHYTCCQIRKTHWVIERWQRIQ